MAHLFLHESGDRRKRAPGRVPIGERKEHQLAIGAEVLLQFEERLLERYDVAAVAVHEEDAREPVGEKVVREVFNQVEVDARRGRERAGEIAVVVRVAQPLERCEQALRGDGHLLHAMNHLA